MRLLIRTFFVSLVLSSGAAWVSAQEPRPLRAPDVRYEPADLESVTAMLKLADVNKSDIVYDLGCGDGRIVIVAAREFGAKGVGIDIDPKRIAESTENARMMGVSNRVTFRNEDLFESDIKEASVVTLYLWPSVNMKLRPKLWKDLKPGTRVVSKLHDMEDWVPDREIEMAGHKIYLWTIPTGKPRLKK